MAETTLPEVGNLSDAQMTALINQMQEVLKLRQAQAAAAMESAVAAATQGASLTVPKTGLDADLLPVFNTGLPALQVVATNLQAIRLLQAILDKQPPAVVAT